MTPESKTKAAKYGLVLGMLGFLSGGMLLCNCPSWFICAGVAAILPSIWGARLVRTVGICICIASFTAAVIQFRHEQTRNARIEKQLRDRQMEARP